MPRRRAAAAAFSAVLSLLAAAPLAAQTASPLLGTWSIEWELGRRVINGETSSINGKGTLSIATSGDSLLATVTTTARDDGAALPAPVTFGGRLTAAGARLVRVSEAVMMMNGEERRQKTTTVWTLSLDGQTLRGTLVREIPGIMDGIPTSPLTGTRVPG
jgi:hypothetical protein